jgi:hypothetical protein
MFNYKQTFNSDYLVCSGALLTDTSKTTADLKPFQLGFFNAKNYKALTGTPDAKDYPNIIIGFGSPNTEEVLGWTNVMESYKTTPINALKLISYRKSYPQRARNQKVAIGYDGVNTCKTMSILCGETKSISVQIEGNPATRFYGQKPLTGRYSYTAPCCGDGEVSAQADAEKMVDYFVTQFNSDRYISPFFRADKIVEYSASATPDTIAYESFTLVVNDVGDTPALARVLVAYPDAYSLKRTSREGNNSTYTLIQLESVTNPVAFTDELGTSVSWVASTAYFKEGREICITLGDDTPVSAGQQIADLVAYFENSDSLDPDSIQLDENGKCANSYTATQYSTNLLKLDECYTGIAEFGDLPSYNGFLFDTCPCAEKTSNTITNIGIVFTGAYVDTKFGKCSYDYNDYVELDIPKIIVTQGEGLDLIGKCKSPWDVTILQRPQYPTGVGENVKRSYIQAAQLRHQIWSDTPRMREVLGFDFDFIDTSKYYKTIYLEFVSLDKTGTDIGYSVADKKTTVSLVFEETVDISAIETLLEGWIASVRPDLIDINSDYKDNNYR